MDKLYKIIDLFLKDKDQVEIAKLDDIFSVIIDCSELEGYKNFLVLVLRVL